MKSIITTVLFFAMSMGFVAQPLLAVAQNNVNYDTPGLVKCEGALTAAEKEYAQKNPTTGKKACNFVEFINTIKYLINWMIFISFPIVIVVFAYAGLLFMSAKEGNISKAKGIFSKVVIGYAFMLGAWLIVSTILKLLVTNSDFLYFFN